MNLGVALCVADDRLHASCGVDNFHGVWSTELTAIDPVSHG
jgi:hypothetical protein